LYAKVGDVFLGGTGAIAKAQKAKKEPNTPWEMDLEDHIGAWVSSSSDELAKYFKDNKSTLDQIAKEFPLLLQPPIGQPVYRGTSIKIDSLVEAFRTKDFEVVKIKGHEVFHFKNLDYNPNRDAQSWTVDPRVAFQFKGKSGAVFKNVHVVYATKVNKDFVFSPKLLKLFFQRDEKETLRVAGKGTFEAFVDSNIIFIAWSFPPEQSFLHKIPKAKPFFDVIVNTYNKHAAAENKKLGVDKFRKAKNIADLTDIAYEDDSELPELFNFRSEYIKAAKKFVKAYKGI